MRIKKAFSTIEMLFVLSMIIVFVLFSIPYNQNKPISTKQMLNKISCLIDECRLYALNYNQDVEIIFEHKNVITPNKNYLLEKGEFIDNKSFTYLKNGHIKKGGSVTYCHNECYTFIFNVGNGAYRIE